MSMRIEGNDQRLAALAAAQLNNTGTQQMLAANDVQQQNTRKVSAEFAPLPVAGDNVSINVEISKNNLDTLQRMGNISDFLNTTATNLRQTNEGLQAASSAVTDMKSSLDQIIKNYPPYPIDSKARIDQLMDFSSLKKQIQSLEIPAPPPPIYDVVKHLWADLFLEKDKALNIPTLASDAPDSQVADVAKQLDDIGNKLSQIKDAISNAVQSK